MSRIKTLIEKMKDGNIPPYVEKIAKKEALAKEALVESVIQGTTVIPCSRKRKLKAPSAIGLGLRTKVNANIGTSSDYSRIEDELEKLDAACKAGTDTVMDLSTGGPVDRILETIVARSPVPVGSVPIYQAAILAREKKGSIVGMTEEDMFEAIEIHC